jgi:hypothetical protein
MKESLSFAFVAASSSRLVALLAFAALCLVLVSFFLLTFRSLLHLMFESGALPEGGVGAAAPYHLPSAKPGPVELLQQFLFSSSFLALVNEACNFRRVEL